MQSLLELARALLSEAVCTCRWLADEAGSELAESTVSKYMIRAPRTAVTALSNDLGPSSPHKSCPDCIIADVRI